ncbi:FadR/GntR family transcriptional regulator [Clostridium sp.]
MIYSSGSNLIESTQKNIIKNISEKIDDVNIQDHYFKEGDFATELGVSRSTVREAVRSLEVRGYVERVHGRGVRAINKSVEAASSLLNDVIVRSGNYDDMLETRRIIEVQCAGIAAIRRSEEQLNGMKECIDKMLDKNISYEEYVDADFSFHRQMINATNNKIMIAIVGSYEHVLNDAILAATNPEYRPEISMEYHLKIYNHILNQDSELAKSSMEDHLEATKNNIHFLHKDINVCW